MSPIHPDELAWIMEQELDKDAILVSENLSGSNCFFSTGFREENDQEMAPGIRAEIEKLGGRVLTCQHALGGISRAIRIKYNTYGIDELVANTLRLFGQGVKVAVEIVLMAADAGLIRTDEHIGGLGKKQGLAGDFIGKALDFDRDALGDVGPIIESQGDQLGWIDGVWFLAIFNGQVDHG